MQIVEEGENRDEMRDGNQWFAAATPEKGTKLKEKKDKLDWIRRLEIILDKSKKEKN